MAHVWCTHHGLSMALCLAYIYSNRAPSAVHTSRAHRQTRVLTQALKHACGRRSDNNPRRTSAHSHAPARIATTDTNTHLVSVAVV